MEHIKNRINTIYKRASAINNPEAMFIFNRNSMDKNFLYVTGLSKGVFENCGVLFEESGKMYLFTTTLEEEMSRTVEKYADLIVYKDEHERSSQLKKILSGYKEIGICYETISYLFYSRLQKLLNGTKLVDVTEAFKMARMVKSQDEIESIRRACSIASDVACSIPAVLKRGITELELGAEIDYLVRKKGAHSAAFKTIVAFAENTSKPHYSGDSIPLREGDVVLVDFGAEYMGYTSDITQTYLTGKPDKDLLDLYSTVYEAQKLAIELIREGIKVEYVEDRVKKYIDNHERYRGRFIHGLGHSLGLDVHDDSYPIYCFNGKFAENMVLTVEPGIYLPGLYGVRLEDDIVVKKAGCEVLTAREKELITYEI